MNKCVFDGCEAHPEPRVQELLLCEEHGFVVYESYRATIRKNVVEYFETETGPLPSGWVYCVLLAPGTVKIGYTKHENPLHKSGLLSRWREVSKEYGEKVIPLAVVPGGWGMESILHQRFHRSRVPTFGEVFARTPEINEWISEHGIDPRVQPAIDRFRRWRIPVRV